MILEILIILILGSLLGITYLGYKFYDSKKVPDDTPDLVDDVKEKLKNRKKGSIKK